MKSDEKYHFLPLTSEGASCVTGGGGRLPVKSFIHNLPYFYSISCDKVYSPPNYSVHVALCDNFTRDKGECNLR